MKKTLSNLKKIFFKQKVGNHAKYLLFMICQISSPVFQCDLP